MQSKCAIWILCIKRLVPFNQDQAAFYFANYLEIIRILFENPEK